VEDRIEDSYSRIIREQETTRISHGTGLLVSCDDITEFKKQIDENILDNLTEPDEESTASLT
jgi:hypothetical protein